MAEKTAEMPPQYTDNPPAFFEPKKTKRFVFGLVFYAGAVTAALIVVTVLGSMYLQKLDEACEQGRNPESDTSTPSTHNSKKYNYDDEEFEVDEEADKEIIKMSGDEYGEGSMVVHDFKKGITGVYNALADECYLIGGIDERVPTPKEISEHFEHGYSGPTYNTTSTFGKRGDRPVTDLSLLPRELHEVCWGKDVFWLERMEDTPADTGESRDKRRITCRSPRSVKVRYNRCYWFCCWVCYRYPNGYVRCYSCIYKGYNCYGEP